MKNKIYLFLLIILFFGFVGASSFNFHISNKSNPSQSYFFINGTTGNIGISNTNPSNKLDITGSMISSSTINSSVDICVEGQGCISGLSGLVDSPYGGGSLNYIPLWEDAYKLIDSPFYQSASNIEISNKNIDISEGFNFKRDTYSILNISKGSTDHYANTFLGPHSSALTKNYVTVFGASAGSTSGDYQTAAGYMAGYLNTGNNQTAIGRESGRSNTADRQTAIGGYRTGYLNTGSSQTAIGYQAGQSNKLAFQTAIGYQAGYSNIWAWQTVAGYQSGYQNQGNYQTAIGYRAGYQNKGNETTFIGFEAGYQNKGWDVGWRDGSYLTAIGYLAGYKNRGDYPTFVGYNAGYQNTAMIFTGIGYKAGYQTTYITSGAPLGSGSLAVGYEAGYDNTAQRASFLGYQAGKENTGFGSLGIGYQALSGNTGDNVVAIGYQAGKDNTENGVFIVKQSNINAIPLMKGVFSTRVVTAVGYDTWSDVSFKENIKDLNYGLKDVLLMKPKQFNFKNISGVNLGLIAQELEEVVPELVGDGIEGKSINYDGLYPVLVKAVQELYHLGNEAERIFIEEPFFIEIKKSSNEKWFMEYVDENLELKREWLDCDSKEIHHKKSCEKIKIDLF